MVAFAAVSDSSGEFAVESPGGLDWPATLLVIAGPSSRPSRRELPVAAESGLVSVEALRSDRSTRLSASGLALGGASVLISDITDRRNQLALGSASSDATGRLPGAWLEPGRDYFLFVTRNGDSIGHPYFVRWRDADELDLAALHSNLTEFESDNAK